jgi:hypothetical protein
MSTWNNNPGGGGRKNRNSKKEKLNLFGYTPDSSTPVPKQRIESVIEEGFGGLNIKNECVDAGGEEEASCGFEKIGVRGEKGKGKEIAGDDNEVFGDKTKLANVPIESKTNTGFEDVGVEKTTLSSVLGITKPPKSFEVKQTATLKPIGIAKASGSGSGRQPFNPNNETVHCDTPQGATLLTLASHAPVFPSPSPPATKPPAPSRPNPYHPQPIPTAGPIISLTPSSSSSEAGSISAHQGLLTHSSPYLAAYFTPGTLHRTAYTYGPASTPTCIAFEDCHDVSGANPGVLRAYAAWLYTGVLPTSPTLRLEMLVQTWLFGHGKVCAGLCDAVMEILVAGGGRRGSWRMWWARCMRIRRRTVETYAGRVVWGEEFRARLEDMDGVFLADVEGTVKRR